MGRTDEEEINIRYEDLDKIIISLEKRKKPKLPRSQVSDVRGMIARSRHKRSTPPIFHLRSDCPVYLGKGLLLPIIFREKKVRGPARMSKQRVLFMAEMVGCSCCPFQGGGGSESLPSRLFPSSVGAKFCWPGKWF